jgi:dTDP-glucose pyrophosphorylase
MWGIIPAAGAGSRIQPLAFSKELLPVGSRREGPNERPRAISEHLIERMLVAGVTKICFVISPGKSDILHYFGGQIDGASICYVVQRHPAGLCDALFQAAPLVAADEHVIVGLPDTLWFPVDALTALDRDGLSLLLFPVSHPELFDAVITDSNGSIVEIQVKQTSPRSNWIWGAIGLTGRVFHTLHDLWRRRMPRDEYVGSLVNAYLDGGGRATGVRAGLSYVDVGTLDGYREANQLLMADVERSAT